MINSVQDPHRFKIHSNVDQGPDHDHDRRYQPVPGPKCARRPRRATAVKGCPMAATPVRLREIEIGEWLADGSVYVADSVDGDDGLWIEWSDGESGYVTNPDRLVMIDRR